MPALSLRPEALRIRKQRKYFSAMMMAMSASTLLFGVAMLLWVLSTLVERGIGGISLDLFTQLPNPPGEPGGGLGQAVSGTLMLTGLAIGLGVPVGLAGGCWLAEFGQQSKPARILRFLADVLMGVPSIVIGVFVYGLMVSPMGGFSGLAGAVALAVVVDSGEISVEAGRAAALASGCSSWRAK